MGQRVGWINIAGLGTVVLGGGEKVYAEAFETSKRKVKEGLKLYMWVMGRNREEMG